MGTDHNLLFGILALQLDFVTREQLVAGMNAWLLEKSKTLGQIFRDQGALDEETHALVEALVEKHVQQHGGDAERSLRAVSSIGSLREALQGELNDTDLHASLAHVSQDREAESEFDPDRTVARSVGESTSSGTRFRILRPHEKGGLGEVFVAFDEELKREVALKEIQDPHADRADSRSRFVVEAEITGGLEHPGIVPVYGLGQYADGRPFYAMRFIRGDSLKEAIERFHDADGAERDEGERTVALRKLLGRFVDVCNAIAYAHSRGVLHRDLKPGNVMLGKYGETLVVDWGLAKAVGRAEEEKTLSDEATLRPSSGSGSDPTQMGSAIGTPAYMSPEQAEGRLDLLGPATDVYGLGATLYCLLTGRAPAEGEDRNSVMRKVREGAIRAPRKIRNEIPRALEAICLKAMAREPGERYASPDELAEDLEHWLADEPVTAARETAMDRMARWQRRHRSWMRAGAVFLVMATAISIVATIVVNRARNSESQARQLAEFERAKADKNARTAARQAEEASEQRDTARRVSYIANVRLARHRWDDRAIREVNRLLEATKPKPFEEDLCGWEWDYLWCSAHADLRTLVGHEGVVLCAAFSPDGRRLASGSRDSTIKLWDVETGDEVLTLAGHTKGFVYSIAFTPNGQWLASGSSDNTIRLWDLETGDEVLTLSGHADDIHSVTFSPDGRRLASGSGGAVKLWDLETGDVILTFSGHVLEVLCVAFSPDGRRIASGSRDSTVKLWDVETGDEILTLSGHADDIHSVTFSPDGRRLASGSRDSTIKLWDVETGDEALTLSGHADDVHSVTISPDGRRLASGSRDRTIRLWDLETGDEVLTLSGHADDVHSVTISTDGRTLASGSADGTIKLWDAENVTGILTLNGHKGDVKSLAFSPDGRRLASGSIDRTIRLWDMETGGEILRLANHELSVNSVAISPDGRNLASGSDDKTIKLWDLETGAEMLTLSGHSDSVYCLTFSPDGQHLASGSHAIKLWDLETGDEIRTLANHNTDVYVRSLAFSPDGRRLASGSFDRTIRLWDMETGDEIVSLANHGIAECVRFNPNGSKLASSGRNAIRFWDVRTNAEILTFSGHVGLVESVAFSPDGRRLASASFDDTIKLWDAETGAEILTLANPGTRIVEFSPDGRQLACGGKSTLDVLDTTYRSADERMASFTVRRLYEELGSTKAVLAAIKGRTNWSAEMRDAAFASVQRFSPSDN